ncbi:hypothetical protein NM688_g504 [Phlebia brevispora]|uniref:Uncharacterized protein n=1 Tax=Phlebia brevispora TaxID=194682 RepID=A0ACC1TDU6_9APHY|nr:hypothetical protein NM688_g504 [Phlebia brevispora]
MVTLRQTVRLASAKRLIKSDTCQIETAVRRLPCAEPSRQLPSSPRACSPQNAREMRAPTLIRLMSTAPPLSTVHRGTAFETKCMRLLEENFCMSLQRVGGTADGGIDLQGWWWLPTSENLPSSNDLAHYRRMRVLAQCKAEKKKTGPAYLREMEGVLHRNSIATVQATSSSEALLSPANQYPTVGLFISMSPFTKKALLHAHSSPFPFCLLHLPEPEDSNADEEEAGAEGIGSIVLNHVLMHSVLRGEVEARLEYPYRPGELWRPGLWWKGKRISSWTPDRIALDSSSSSIDSVYNTAAEGETTR